MSLHVSLLCFILHTYFLKSENYKYVYVLWHVCIIPLNGGDLWFFEHKNFINSPIIEEYPIDSKNASKLNQITVTHLPTL